MPPIVQPANYFDIYGMKFLKIFHEVFYTKKKFMKFYITGEECHPAY